MSVEQLTSVASQVASQQTTIESQRNYASDKKRRTNKSPAALPDLESKIRKFVMNDAVAAIYLPSRKTEYRQIWQLRGGPNLLA